MLEGCTEIPVEEMMPPKWWEPKTEWAKQMSSHHGRISGDCKVRLAYSEEEEE